MPLLGRNGSIGQDCFVNVDHDAMTRAIKDLGVTTIMYLKDRQKEKSDQASDFRLDSILTDMLSLIYHLHRATIRNWHHLAMLAGNLGNAAPPEVAESRKKAKIKQSIAKEAERAKHDVSAHLTRELSKTKT